SLIMLDIDHFKGVNDTYGHDAGDVALRLIAGALREEVRGVDTAARYGGEEFAVILPQAGPEGALVVAERLRARIESTQIPGVGHVTASLGVATFPIHASSRDLLVTTADRALYQAKHTGRNRVSSPRDLPPEELLEATAPHAPEAADAPGRRPAPGEADDAAPDARPEAQEVIFPLNI
ncbi:MAG TPA: GGDEF domain-containing protein, partial [Pyrinomonadaceae bacterium]|nr:GGDEF domain-containing protein [Pyrinomonadaceae bacterium]